MLMISLLAVKDGNLDKGESYVLFRYSQRLLKQPLLNQLYVVWSVTNTGVNLG